MGIEQGRGQVKSVVPKEESEIDKVWSDFQGVAIDDDGNILEPFRDFKAGVHREIVWQWLEEQYLIKVHDLLFPKTPVG